MAHDLTERIRIEHEILGHVRSALQVAIDAPIEAATAHEWLERTAFLFASFARHLARLFEIEDEAGYMGAVLAHAPTLGWRTDRLYEEHCRLLWLVGSIGRDAARIDPENLSNLYELQQRVQGFLGQLESHQKAERDLLVEAFLVDIGGEG